MALALAYLNEVLNQYSSTVIFDEQAWTPFIQALKFEGRSPEQCVVGRMALRCEVGGYDGLMRRMAALQDERDVLAKRVEELTRDVPVPSHA